MSEEKGMVSQEAVTATSADAGSIMPLAADLSRTQDVTTVSEVSTINSTDQFYMNQSGKFVQVDYSKLADAILGKISSKTYSLDQGTKTLIAALNELNSKTLGCESIGEIRQGDSEYNSSAANKALQDAYAAIVRTSYFNGLLYARREDSINPTYWRVEGLKSSDNYGYIKITSYSNNMEEHKYVLMEGSWSWIS